MIVRVKGLKGPEPAHKRAGIRAMAPLPDVKLPDFIDYSDLFGPVQDQGQVGCCVAEATLGIYEAKVKKHVGVEIQNSRRALYQLAHTKYEPQDAGQDVGMFPSDALKVLAEIGRVDPKNCPEMMEFGPEYFRAIDPEWIETDHLLNNFVYVGGTNGETAGDLVVHLKRTLIAHGPIAVGFEWANAWEEPANGILNPNPDENDRAGGHEVILVGYDYAKQAFKIRNSWGSDWGLGGYCWLPYSTAYSRLPWDAYAIEADR